MFAVVTIREAADARDAYMEAHGPHFSERAVGWAASMMERRDAGGGLARIRPFTRDEVESMLSRHGQDIGGACIWDAVYAADMCRADHMGGSVMDEAHMARFVREYVDDPDGYEGMPFTRFVADCRGAGTPIPWGDII